MAISAPLHDAAPENVFLQSGSDGQSLGELVNNEYILKRIVGKTFWSVSQASGVNKGAILCAAGFFVARAEDEFQGSGAGAFPIGALDTGVFADYAPLNQRTMREPWIWRRTWVLSNQLTNSTTEITSFPRTNVEYGSIQDGAHIDAKTARRIRNGERLFFAIQARAYPVNHILASDAGDVTVHNSYEIRALGALRKAHNRSSF